MCNRKVSWDERKDAAGNGISCVRERTSGGEMDLLGELDMAVAGAYRSGRGQEIAGGAARAGRGD